MLDAVTNWLVDPAGLTPHGFCLLWEPGLIWTHAVSDIGIGLAYFSIPVALSILARRRRDVLFRPLFWLFAVFILLCGTTHVLAVLTLWQPAYWLEGIVKAATAAVSLVTAAFLWRLLPRALSLPSQEQLEAANTALRESEARHRASVERSPVPLFAVDSAARITTVSDSWLALFGYERESVIGRPIADFRLPGQDWSPTVLERIAAEGEANEMERRFVRHDGSVIEALVSGRAERRGEEVGAVCVVIDITARRRAEAALRESEDRLHQAQKMEAVGQLTGGIAHDFNNMLQGVVGTLDLLERRVAQGRTETAGEYIAAIRRSAERAAALTQRLLAFARRQALQPRPVQPNELVQGIAELIRRTVGPTIQVALRLGEDVWPALCDPNQLESALVNLAINARDAMPGGGTLVISTSDRQIGEDELPAGEDVRPGPFVEIAVADDGVGMPPDVMARAFEPFYTTKPIGQGTGLGLSQLYGFVRQSGGFVRLQSLLGRGTTVHIFLPRLREAAPAQRDQDRGRADPAPAGAVSGVALVVDDEDVVRAQVAAALQDMGLSILEAADGPAGLDVLQSGRPVDLLVTDIGLPGLNGRQLAEAARVLRPGLPVVLITGFAGTALEEMALDPSMQILGKPFALDALAATVRRVTKTATAGHVVTG